MHLAIVCVGAVCAGLLVGRALWPSTATSTPRPAGRSARRWGVRGATALPFIVSDLWRLVYGEGRGHIGDRLAAADPSLADLPALDWQLRFAGYRGRDAAWFRRHQLRIALGLAVVGLLALVAFDLPLVLAVPLVPAALVGGVLAMRVKLRVDIANRQRDMRSKCVPWLRGLAAFLSTRTSLQNALRAMSTGKTSELAYETREMLAKLGVGARLDTALATFAARCNTPEIEMAVTAIRMQQQAGSSNEALAETLRQISQQTLDTIASERTQQRKKWLLQTYVELIGTAVPFLIVAAVAPFLYESLRYLG